MSAHTARITNDNGILIAMIGITQGSWILIHSALVSHQPTDDFKEVHSVSLSPLQFCKGHRD
ncbi:unnamed protein product [Commensalibacter communis]|nr:unnamed protein product [Commensalibacter communis]CAI3958415.1 unnamed protein product [Commensalibacter communis]